MKKNLLRVMFFVVLLTCVAIGGTNIRMASGNPQPNIWVDPASKNVVIGTTFTISMSIKDATLENTGYGVYGWEFRISFNASILEGVSIAEGPFLKTAGATSWNLISPTIEPGNIVASNSLYPPMPAQGAVGAGALATITFQPIGVGTTTIHVYMTELRTYDGTDILPVDHTRTNGSVTVTAGHDVAVISVTAPPEAAKGSSVPIDVTVENQGSFNETSVTVNVYNETSLADTTTFGLNAGEETTRSLSWDADVPKGTYTIKATASIAIDNDTTDNYRTRTIRIVEHDVAVIQIYAPSTAKAGATVPIDVEVENQGANSETANVAIKYDSTPIDNKNVPLASGAKANASFSWDTSGKPTGTYTLTATATISVDDDSTDNTKTKTIKLELLHDVAVINLTAPAEAPLGLVYFNVTVKNEGDYAEMANVTVQYDSTYIDSESVALAIGQTKIVLFTWDTSGKALGLYTLRAVAGWNNIDTWTGDGTRKVFYTTKKPVALYLERVYVGGVLKTRTTHYTIDYTNGTITFITAPGSGVQVKAAYLHRQDDDSADNSMTKSIKLTSHDIAVIGIEAPAKAFANFKFYVNVTVRNEGTSRETITLTLKYDSNFIENKTFDLIIAETKEVSFIWDLTGVSLGAHTISATADILPSPFNEAGSDYDPADNSDTAPISVYSWIPGDGDFNGLVEMPDFYIWRKYFGKSPPWPVGVNPDYDPVASPNYVDMYDFYAWRNHWGQTVDP